MSMNTISFDEEADLEGAWRSLTAANKLYKTFLPSSQNSPYYRTVSDWHFDKRFKKNTKV